MTSTGFILAARLAGRTAASTVETIATVVARRAFANIALTDVRIVPLESWIVKPRKIRYVGSRQEDYDEAMPDMQS